MAEPITVTLTLDLDKHLARYVGYDAEGEPVQQATSIEDVVVDIAARQFINGLDRDVKSEVARRVREIRDDEIRAQVAPLVAEAIERSVQATDGYGNPKGEPKTMAEVIVQTAVASLQKSDRYSNGGRTLVQQFLHDEVERAFKNELKATVDQAKAEVLAAVKERGSEVLAQTIASMAGTR